jgi:hypothetical protein
MAHPDAGELFDVYLVVDWSARSASSPVTPCADALWVGELDRAGDVQAETYWRTRGACIDYLARLLLARVEAGKRCIIGYDFNFGFPAGFAAALGLVGHTETWKRLWDHLCGLIVDRSDNTNNRFAVAAALNAVCTREGALESGPFWGCPSGTRYPSLAPTSPTYPFRTRLGPALRWRRWTEEREGGTQPVWKLLGRGSVGGQTLLGIPAVARLRFHPVLAPYSAIWPFETGFAGPVPDGPRILHVEIWPGGVAGKGRPGDGIKDRSQVRAAASWLEACDAAGTLLGMLGTPDGLPVAAQAECVQEEGWILGSGASSLNGSRAR